MTTVSSVNAQIKGNVFAAQACSCGCDPCVCGDACTCEGADAYLGPRWRFVGDMITTGTIDGIDVSQHSMLHLAEQSSEQPENWHEVILIDDKATSDQVCALLALFEAHQGSEVAHQDCVSPQQRPVYLVPMHYATINGHEMLCVTFSPTTSCLLRDSDHKQSLRDWSYNGHVAMQAPLEQSR